MSAYVNAGTVLSMKNSVSDALSDINGGTQHISQEPSLNRRFENTAYGLIIAPPVVLALLKPVHNTPRTPRRYRTTRLLIQSFLRRQQKY